MPDDQRTKNDDAMAWVERWYATPDAQPPGYWDALLAEIDATSEATVQNLAQVLQGYYDLPPGHPGRQGEAVLVPRAHLACMLALLQEAGAARRHDAS